MSLLSSMRDFADGLSRGFGLFFTERHDFVGQATAPGLVRRNLRKP